MDSFPLYGTRNDKISWSSQAFRGWGIASFRLFEPIRGTKVITHGYVCLRSPCKIFLVGKVQEWLLFNRGTVRVSFTYGANARTFYFGDDRKDTDGLLWFATEAWLRDEKIGCSQGAQRVLLQAMRRHLFHEAVLAPSVEGTGE